jgi:YVTN family beta-propeller protein
MRIREAALARNFGAKAIGLVFASLLATGAAMAQGKKTPKPGLVVLSKDESRLLIVDPQTFKVVSYEQTGAYPHEVAVSDDGKLAITTNYGAHADGDSLSVVDLDKMQEVGHVTYPGCKGPHGIVIQGSKAYFTNEGDKTVVVFDFVANTLDQQIVEGQKRPHMLVLTKDGHTIFVANIESNNVSVLTTKDGKSWDQSNVGTGKGPEGMDMSPDEKEVWAANSQDGTVAVIDVKKKKVVAKIELKTQRSNRLKFTPDGKLVLVSDMGGGELVIVDAATRKEVKRLPLGKSPEGILVQPDGARAFVAVSGEDKIAVVDLKTLEVTTTFPAGKDPDGLAWRP